MISCCSSLVTPNQTITFGVMQDILTNPVHAVSGTKLTVELLTTIAGGGGSGTSCAQSAGSATRDNLVPGIAAFGTTPQTLSLIGPPMTTIFVSTETPFIPASLSDGQLLSLTNRCNTIISNSGGYGICASPQLGALGAQKK